MRNFSLGSFILLICVALTGFKPDVKNASRDFVKIREAYKKAGKLSMDMEYKVYQGHESDLLKEEHTGHYLKSGNDNLYMELFGTLTICNREIKMVKDDSGKVVLLTKPVPEDTKQPLVDMEKMLQVCSQVTALPSSKMVKGYHLEFGDQIMEMKAVEVYFDTTTYLVQKVILFYAKDVDVHPEYKWKGKKSETYKPRLEVEYQHINTNPVVSELKFSADKYIKKTNNKWKLQPALAKYQLLDQTTQSARP